MATGTEIIRLTTHGQHIVEIAMSGDHGSLAGISITGQVLLWDTHQPEPLAILSGHTSGGGSIALSRDGTLLASGSDKEVIVWDVVRRTQIGSLPVAGGVGGVIAFSPDGRTLAVGGSSPSLWDVDVNS